MPFCQNCGASVDGRFCVKCGTPVGAAAPPAATLGATAAAAPQAVTGQVARKTSPWVWVLVGILGFFMLIGIGLVGAGWFVVHKVKQAGLDPDLMRRNPGLAMTRLLAHTNPDLEVLNVNERRGIITLKDRKTGKVVTMNFDDVKNGKLTFEADGEKVSMEAHGEGDQGTFEMKSSNGATVKLGEGKLPDWVPAYPGATVRGALSMRGTDGEAGTFAFKTSDPPAGVLAFYNDKLTAAGFKITTKVSGEAAGSSSGGVLTAEDTAAHRTITVTAGAEGSETNVGIITQKKP